jgi:tetratricopeptide (TPR) repeat protein
MRRLLALSVLLAAGVAPGRAESYLIIPFFNLSKSANLDWIGESISETVREALVWNGVLALGRDDREEAAKRLSLRTSSRLTLASIIKLGETLDADRVIYGEFEWKPGEEAQEPPKGSLSITAHILDLKGMRRGPEFVERGPMADLSALQTRLAWRALKLVTPKAWPSEQEFFKSRPPVRIDAMENYIRGLLAPVEEQKHRFFTQAARLDTGFSQPCFQLGRMQWKEKRYRVAAQWLERVTAADAHYLEANFLLGLCRYYMSDYAGAAQAFEVVSRSVPLNEVYNNLGAAQSRENVPAALQNILKALDGDPTDPDYHFNAGYILWKQGNFTEAAERFRAVLDRTPEDKAAIMMLGRCLQQSGPRKGDLRTEGLERLKENYEETAYRQLKSILEARTR